MIHIKKDNTGDFSSVSEALASLPANNKTETILYIHEGIYKEQITVLVPFLTFLGDGPDKTILTYDLSAREMMEDGMKRGTFRTYSCMIDTHDFTAKGITFANSAGSGPQAGQALALYVDGDRIQFENCHFSGGQDTLFTAPLPPKEIEKNGFIGPKQYSPRINGRHYYKSCLIEGDIDFIFGGATAYFEDCEFFSKDIGRRINSYVTAASTPKNQAYGYVMNRCRFTGNCPPRSAYLGRPWREYAKTVLLHCFMDEHICEEGWNDWNKTDARQTVFYAEYGNYGKGADISKRPSWIKRLEEKELAQFEKAAVLSGDDGWQPL